MKRIFTKTSFLCVTIFIVLFIISIGYCLAEGSDQTTGQSQGQPPTQTAAQGQGQPPYGYPPSGGPPGQAMPGASVPLGAQSQPQASSSSTPSSQAESSQAVETSTPLSEEKIAEGVKVSQEKISLDLKGIDILELFRILSLKMGVTIVPTRSVTGRVNIFLNNLTFDDALDVILMSQDLTCVKKENIITIMTVSEYERLYGKKYNETRKIETVKLNYAKPSTVFSALAQLKSDVGKIIADETSGTLFLIDIPEKLELMKKTVVDLDVAPLTEIIDLKYAKPADIKTHLSSAITTGPGEIFVDERSSKIVVSDLPEKMKKLKRIIKAFDEETRQVFIEAEIVQISLRDENQRGINWEKFFNEKDLHSLDFQGTFPVNPSFSPSPALTTSALQMAIGVLSSDHYTSTLQLLQSYGDTKILSRPRIAVINNQEAKIMVGSREAYVTQTLSQAETTTVTSESIQFIDVGVKLNVVPTISKDGFISMKIKPEVSSVRETLTTSMGSVVPIVETAEAETVVKVKDGSMIMIAGLMKEEKRKDALDVPFFSRIPILGMIFSSRAHQKKNTEVIVFITPHIISGDALVAGTEPEKLIPPSIMPKELKDSIISKKVEDIQLKPLEVSLPADKSKIESTPAPVKEEESTIDIQEKAKGIKEY
jgi:type II secretory pathway component GspD/PulD (secretin)